MALPINIPDLINQRVAESARIEYKGNRRRNDGKSIRRTS